MFFATMPQPPFDRKRGDEMGGKKTAGIVLLVVGIVVLLLSLFYEYTNAPGINIDSLMGNAKDVCTNPGS